MTVIGAKPGTSIMTAAAATGGPALLGGPIGAIPIAPAPKSMATGPGTSVYLGGSAGGATLGAKSAYFAAPTAGGGGGAKSVALGGPKGQANLLPGQSAYFGVGPKGATPPGTMSTYM
uniref:Tropoelastin n=1 Tax=Angiostrongylus cantonensis TaxID=6313 RepID=A0A0K0DN37_ANGCA